MKQLDLTSSIVEFFRIDASQKKALERLGLQHIFDLLYHFPSRYQDISEIKAIHQLVEDDHVTIYGKISKLKTKKAFRKKIPLSEATLEDGTGKISIVWFHQPYIAKLIKDDDLVKVSGKVGKRGGALYLANPEIEQTKSLPIDISDSLFEGNHAEGFYPVYPESKGITSRWFYHALQKIIKSNALDALEDPIPEEIRKTYNLPSLKSALIWIHAPRKQDDHIAARKRFAFQEIFLIQIGRIKQRHEYEKNPSFNVNISTKDIEHFLGRFPFSPTQAQQKAIKHITDDFKKNHPMTRLLEGDVGSGKTLVAAATAYSVVTSRPEGQNFGNLQVAYMAPTEILAQQHFQSFIEYFSHLPIQIGLITGSGCRKFPSKVDPTKDTTISRAQLLRWVANGEIAILIGTHALIQKSVAFKHLAYTIIDEQHRFGIMQRMNLAKKKSKESVFVPHLLSMTATPIPRTLALTIYGDLDLTLLDELPKGRKPIITDIILPAKRASVYEKVRKELEAGRQAYVICPRIDEPDKAKALALNVRSVKEEAKRLKEKIFPEYTVDILHSKMRPAEKDAVMKKFEQGDTNILVATSVVEVGVNVPNATVIIIEGAERFGLSQLHQLRGRVLRSSHQAYCYVFADTKNKKSLERLNALKTAKNGFELSELDLHLRGAGELSGKKQWGISDLGMEAIKNIKMVEAARHEAEKIISADPELTAYPYIKKLVALQEHESHFE